MKGILEKYLSEISKITQRGDAREETYYPALKNMLEAVAVKQKRKGVDAVLIGAGKNLVNIVRFLPIS